MNRGISKVDRTIHLLRNGFCTNSNEDTQLLVDVRTQLSLYCANLMVEGVNSELADNLNNALPFLSNKISNLYSPSTTTQTYSNNNNNELHNNGITFSIINGKLVYFLDGKQIRFKVPKNKPKNGDFKVRWNRSFESLKEFQAKYKTTRVTRSTPGHRELGNWVAEQRRKFKTGKITQRQFEVLNEIGFEWDRSSYFFNTFKKKGTGDSDEDYE